MKFILLYGDDQPLYYTSDSLDELYEFIEEQELDNWSIHELGRLVK
ncbi:MAG: hypothetical protein R3321_00380 [Nitrososphaeraceae archaeon]|nr:hypothetical protein [Nitrososphaeraceae archaeon]